MKRITVELVVAESYLYSDTQRKVKNDLAEAALLSVKNNRLDLVSITTRVGTVRKGSK